MSEFSYDDEDDSGDWESSDASDEALSELSSHSHGDYSSRPSRRLNACIPSDGLDRFSSLPQSLIIHILSFLPIGDKIKTGALSKPWQYLWTFVPEIYFLDDDGPQNLAGFIEAVDKTLLLCNGPSVNSLRVDFPGNHKVRYASKVNLWTRFASRNEIHRFDLRFCDPMEQDEDNKFYELPQLLFTSSSFKELNFMGCIVSPRGAVAWKSLKKLSIRSSAKLSDDAIGKIIVGSPVLEVLELCLPRNYYRLDLSKSNVKKLTVKMGVSTKLDLDDPFILGISGFEILAPTVEYLHISGSINQCKLVDVSSVVEAHLSELRCLFNTRAVLENLVHVQTLTFKNMEEGMVKLFWSCADILFPKCKWLSIPMMELKESDVSAFVKFLGSFPAMETLLVEAIFYWQTRLLQNWKSNKHQDWTSGEVSCNFLTRLRTVKFDGFENESFSFVQFLLKNARLLQNMTINLKGQRGLGPVSHKTLFEVSQRLLSFPRSSPFAELLVYK